MATISVNKIKEAFRGGNVPTAKDFANLIDLAALGPAAGPGLSWGQDGILQIQCQKDGGLSVEGGLAVNAGGGLSCAGGALAVSPGHGLEFGAAAAGHTLPLKLKREDDGLMEQSNVLSVRASIGLKASKDGLALNIDGKSLMLDPDTGGALKIRCAAKGGLRINDKGELTLDLDSLSSS